jgi:hypothetical protein
MLLVLLVMAAFLVASALVTPTLSPMVLPVVMQLATISEVETTGTTHLQVVATGIPTARVVVRPEVVALNGVLLLQERNQNGKV